MNNISKVLTLVLCVCTCFSTACAKDALNMNVDPISEYGYIFITAPGYGIWCADISGNDVYVQKDGTSFSAPIVAAMAAGTKQLKSETDTEQFKELLKNTSTDLDEPGYDTNTGYGLIDFNKLFGAINPVCCIAAAYDSNGVLHATSINNEYRYGDSLPIIEADTEYTIRYLFWDSIENMCPSITYSNKNI